ncbi:Cation/multidrug efflux pump [Rubellimicrobium thermophilum DSM 16684]|uniref:Cation/multidrug efflux pump n=1 Tax=Rubellimicrobium thermophilum DSM 16684 TaxID=1123069 RepID=S9SL83_9RHOB|nr:efflux RND transporter permease subunit [Rubellimicrobium thermophilum]EPX87109.1 Cation/multidrug efflux pump [Rubellimicrobium thermophilum DSM 16684]
MNFSAWSIRNPIAPILFFLLLMILGWQSFRSLPITQFPSIDIPLVAVSVSQSGAAPAEMETQVTRQIEDAVAGIAGVKNVTSTVSDGVSQTLVEFRLEVPTDQAVQDVKDAIDRILGDLPAEVETPVVTRIDVEGQAIMTFAVSAPGMTVEELSWFVDNTIAGELQGQLGVGRVDRYGGADREIRVELDPLRLDAYGVTAAAVSQQIRAINANQGAGRSEIGGGEQAIRLLGDRGDAERLAAMPIALPSGQRVTLDQLGTVTDSFEEPRSFARYDGQEVVVFSVYKAKGASEVSVAELTEATLDRIRAEHPDVSITLVDDQVSFTYGNYEAAIHTLIEGGILAVLVVLAFLRNWRATIIAAIALPLSAIPTFWAMEMLGFSLNLVSFLAITLATGILVDDAIVEIENIQRHVRMGKTPYRAAIDAADEIGLAVIATTATIVAVFVPVSFMPGIAGQYFRQFGLTVALAVIFSLLVARLITPMLAAYFMRSKDADERGGHGDGLLMRGYLRLVRATATGRLWILPGRYLTLLAAFGVLAVSVFFMAQIPGSFMPEDDSGRIPVSVELPPGSTLEDTRLATDRILEAVRDIDGVEHVFVLGGSSPTGDRDVRRASVTVLLEERDTSLSRKLHDLAERIPVLGSLIPDKPVEGRSRSQSEIEMDVSQAIAPIPDIRAYRLNVGPGGGGRDISYSILSDDAEALNLAVARLEEALRGDPLFTDVSTEGALPRPEVQITPRADDAARLGVTTAAIAQTVRVATIGDFDAANAKLSIDDRLIPVRVRLTEAARDDLVRLAALRVPTATGATVPLSAVADIAVAEGPSVVKRLNRDRVATIGATLSPGVALGTATARFEEIMAGVELPPGVRIAESGDAEAQAELNAGFLNSMVLGLFMVLGVLILLFRSVIQPFTILFSLPLAIGGVAAALILTNSPVSMPVLIGILMLMGIVTKNAILLVDFAIEMRADGMSRFDAVVEAGHKRARPIIMTSIAMSAGMLPSALGVGDGGSFRAPMATAVIGGILMSTVLSLVVVPSFFLIMDDLQRLLTRIFGRFVGPREAEEPLPDPRDLAHALAAERAERMALEQRLMRIEAEAARPRLHVAE